MQATLRISLKKDEERLFRKGDPWLFSHQFADSAQLAASPAGVLAQVMDDSGAPLGIGFTSPHSLLAWRELQRGLSDSLPDDWIHTRLHAALTKRQQRFDVPYFRLVHAESDHLPGLIIDRFGAILVVQISIPGMERVWPQIEAALLELIPEASILLRNDLPIRAKENMREEVRVATGNVPALAELEEYGVTFLADLWKGPKTGWDYAQRDNRAMAASHAKDKTVLDLFAHSGGFGIQAAVAGASDVLMVDASSAALELAIKAAAINGVTAQIRTQQGDAFAVLEQLAKDRAQFDIVIADPPNIIPSSQHLPQGLRSYERLSRMAALLVKPGGTLMIASSSYHLTAPMLKRCVLEGVRKAARSAEFTRMTGASADYPSHPALPQSSYLHCAWLTMDA